MVHQRVFSMSPLAALQWITRQGLALQEYKLLVIEMNKRGRNTPAESPNFSLSPQYIQWGSSLQPPPPLSAALSWGLRLVCVADRNWHGRGEELSAPGAGMGTVPHGLLLPLPLFFSSLSLVCKCISISYDLSVSFFSPRCDLPLPDSHPLSRSRSLYLFPSIFVSLTLSFPTARPAFILIPLPPWVF